MSGPHDQRAMASSPWTAALAAARERWPADWVPDDAFSEHLRGRVPADADPAAALDQLAVGDLYLACACLRGVAAALEAFARGALGEVATHIASIDRSAAFADEVRQTLAARLLVAEPGARPKLDDYAGRAPLSAWVRVAAIRTALNLRRGRAIAAEAGDDQALADCAASGDVELDLVRRRYGAAFEAAIAQALGELSPRERTLLRLRLLDGVEVERIATMYGVHRTTVTRWMSACQDRLLDATRRILRDDLGLATADIDSLAGLVHSQLHVSLHRLLREP